MPKKILKIGLAIIIIIVFFMVFQIYSFNNRNAENLSSYCNIDFIGIKDEGIIKEASLEIIDFRYFSNKLYPEIVLIVDNEEYHMATNKVLQVDSHQGNFLEQLKDKNSLMVFFNKVIVGKIKQAKIVKVGFKYEGDKSFKIFKLSDIDLIYWKNQL